MLLLGSKLSSSKVVNNIEGYLNAFTFIFLFIAKFDKMCRVIMRKEWGTLKVSTLPRWS